MLHVNSSEPTQTQVGTKIAVQQFSQKNFPIAAIHPVTTLDARRSVIVSLKNQPLNSDQRDRNGLFARSTAQEKQHFGADWQNIAGVEVGVTRVMFKDNSMWIPAKGQFCKAVFVNEDYDAALMKWQDRGGLLAGAVLVSRPSWAARHPQSPTINPSAIARQVARPLQVGVHFPRACPKEA